MEREKFIPFVKATVHLQENWVSPRRLLLWKHGACFASHGQIWTLEEDFVHVRCDGISTGLIHACVLDRGKWYLDSFEGLEKGRHKPQWEYRTRERWRSQNSFQWGSFDKSFYIGVLLRERLFTPYKCLINTPHIVSAQLDRVND